MTQESVVTADVVHQSVPHVYEHSMLCGHCGTPLDFSIEGDLGFAFCIQCKRVDAQAFVALEHLFAWLRQHEPSDRLEFAAFGEIRSWRPPLDRPPVTYPYVRLWQLNYALGDGKTNKAVLVALQADGTYVSEQHHYPRCWDIPLSTTCGNYLVPNERDVLACPDHGEVPQEGDRAILESVTSHLSDPADPYEAQAKFGADLRRVLAGEPRGVLEAMLRRLCGGTLPTSVDVVSNAHLAEVIATLVASGAVVAATDALKAYAEEMQAYE